MALTYSGEVLGFGYNNVGQLGREGQQQMVPVQVLTSIQKKLVDVQCGSMFTFFTTYDNQVYAAGLNDANQLGTNTLAQDVFIPQQVAISKYQVIALTAG